MKRKLCSVNGNVGRISIGGFSHGRRSWPASLEQRHNQKLFLFFSPEEYQRRQCGFEDDAQNIDPDDG